MSHFNWYCESLEASSGTWLRILEPKEAMASSMWLRFCFTKSAVCLASQFLFFSHILTIEKHMQPINTSMEHLQSNGQKHLVYILHNHCKYLWSQSTDFHSNDGSFAILSVSMWWLGEVMKLWLMHSDTWSPRHLTDIPTWINGEQMKHTECPWYSLLQDMPAWPDWSQQCSVSSLPWMGK